MPAAAQHHRWWAKSPSERFWLEITSRDDLGNDLRAPQRNGTSGEYWGYSLLTEVQPGDHVLHFDLKAQAVVGQSIASGAAVEQDLLWAARGTFARAAGTEPYMRPGWHVPLEQFRMFAHPLRRSTLVEQTGELSTLCSSLKRQFGDPLYFPFIIYKNGRPLTPAQAYLTKWPVGLFDLFPQLRPESLPSTGPNLQDLADQGAVAEAVGSTYRPADEASVPTLPEPPEIDPAVLARGLQAHAATQNQLAAFLRANGCVPLSPSDPSTSFDIAWWIGQRLFVAEVKSITELNEERQLRLGLGQLLRYRWELQRADREVAGVLVVERAPRDASWVGVCASVGIELVWPDSFKRISCFT